MNDIWKALNAYEAKYGSKAAAQLFRQSAHNAASQEDLDRAQQLEAQINKMGELLALEVLAKIGLLIERMER